MVVVGRRQPENQTLPAGKSLGQPAALQQVKNRIVGIPVSYTHLFMNQVRQAVGVDTDRLGIL